MPQSGKNKLHTNVALCLISEMLNYVNGSTIVQYWPGLYRYSDQTSNLGWKCFCWNTDAHAQSLSDFLLDEPTNGLIWLTSSLMDQWSRAVNFLFICVFNHIKILCRRNWDVRLYAITLYYNRKVWNFEKLRKQSQENGLTHKVNEASVKRVVSSLRTGEPLTEIFTIQSNSKTSICIISIAGFRRGI